MEEAKKQSSGRQLIILGLAVVVMRRHLLRALEGSPRSVLTSSPLPKPSTRNASGTYGLHGVGRCGRVGEKHHPRASSCRTASYEGTGRKVWQPIVAMDPAQVRKLRNGGLSWRAIAAETGVAKDTLRRSQTAV
jgi:hypothetical protein